MIKYQYNEVQQSSTMLHMTDCTNGQLLQLSPTLVILLWDKSRCRRLQQPSRPWIFISWLCDASR